MAKRRRLLAVLERLEDRLVPSGFASLSLDTFLTVGTSPGTVGVQDVQLTTHGGGPVETPSAGFLSPIAAVEDLVESAASRVLDVVSQAIESTGSAPAVTIGVELDAAGNPGSQAGAPGAAPGLAIDVPGVAALKVGLPVVAQILGAAGTSVVEPVSTLLDVFEGAVAGGAGDGGSGGEGGGSAIGGTGLLGAGTSVSIAGVSVTLPLLSLNLALGASTPSDPSGGSPGQDPPPVSSGPGAPGGTGSSPGVPTAPTVPGGSGTSGSPSSPAPAVGVPVSPAPGKTLNPPTTPVAGIPGSDTLPGASHPRSTGTTPGSTGTTPAGVAFGVGIAAVPPVALASIDGSAELPTGEEQTAAKDASSTADPSAPTTVSGLGQVVAADPSDADPGRLEQTAVLPARSPVVPHRPASPEVEPDAPASPADLLLRDLEGLESALGALMQRFDDLGEDLTAQLTHIGTLELLLGVGLGGVAFEVLRRRERQKRRANPQAQFRFTNLPGPFYRPDGLLGSAGRGLLPGGAGAD